MAACTLTQSFRQALPRYDRPHITAGTHISGSTTASTDAPPFGVLAAPDDHVNRGHGTLAKVARTLDREYIFLPEASMAHLSEGYVARAAAMYLIHPINQALSAIPDFNNSIQCLSEATFKGVRSDITFNRLVLGYESRCFAAVEFKKRGVIDENEFRRALRTIDRKSPVDKLVADAHKQKGHPFFKDNSNKLMKQAGAYAIRHRTQYVALFNWDYLILIRFPGLDPRLDSETLGENGVGDFCELSILNYATHAHIMRVALLGFLVQAYMKTPLT
ncbi:hypothetical protein F5Y16DRAFT_219089 [Xylariaceae sp. FL0255]|nr:hypothetical protein F5Y16DRAFT_219089 [Xylariaceae sp. FL0255]